MNGGALLGRRVRFRAVGPGIQVGRVICVVSEEWFETDFIQLLRPFASRPPPSLPRPSLPTHAHRAWCGSMDHEQGIEEGRLSSIMLITSSGGNLGIVAALAACCSAALLRAYHFAGAAFSSAVFVFGEHCPRRCHELEGWRVQGQWHGGQDHVPPPALAIRLSLSFLMVALTLNMAKGLLKQAALVFCAGCEVVVPHTTSGVHVFFSLFDDLSSPAPPLHQG